MELPIPHHLKKILNPIGQNNSEFEVLGQVHCECGNDEVEIHFVGDDDEYDKLEVIKIIEIENQFFLIIKFHCNQCSSEHLLFDNDYHGWNGFVCEGDNRASERPNTKKWTCDCGNHNHKVKITIASEGKEDFLAETEGEFSEENWVNAFGWITMDIECISCGKNNPEWISYETM